MITKEKFCQIANGIIALEEAREDFFEKLDSTRVINLEPFYNIVPDYIAIRALAAAVDDEDMIVEDWFNESDYGYWSVDLGDGIEVSSVEELYDYVTRGKGHE